MPRENDDACANCSAVIPGASHRVRAKRGPMTGSAREPGIHIIGCGVWIPGSPLRGAPE